MKQHVAERNVISHNPCLVDGGLEISFEELHGPWSCFRIPGDLIIVAPAGCW